MTDYVLHADMLLPRSFSSHFEDEGFDVLGFVTENAPLSEQIIQDFLSSFHEHVDACLAGDGQRIRQFGWTLDFLVVLGLKKNPHKTLYPVVVLDILRQAMGVSLVDWRTAGTLNPVLRELLVNVNPVSELISSEMCTNKVWHVNAHSNEMFYRKHIDAWCARLSEEQRLTWCPPVLSVEELSRQIVLVPGPEGQLVPPRFLPVFSDESISNLPTALHPLDDETAKLIIQGFQLHHQLVFVEKSKVTDPFEWADWLLDDYSGAYGLGPNTVVAASDLLTLLQAGGAVLASDDLCAAYFAAGFVEEMLQNRREVWADLAESILEDSSCTQVLQGTWIPASIAAQMPEPLRSNVQIVADFKQSAPTK